MQKTKKRPGAPQPRLDYPLLPMQLKVLQGIAEGFTNKEIAATGNVSEQTVKTHVSSIFEKLGAKNRSGSIRIGIEKGIIKVADFPWEAEKPRFGLRLVPIDSIRPPFARVNTDDISLARVSLEKYGQTIPLLIQDGVIISSDVMWWAARSMGWRYMVVYEQKTGDDIT